MIISAARPSSLTAALQRLRVAPNSAIAAGLFVLTILSRLPFGARILYHWDAINFAFSLQRFDVAAEQPQLPGYILFVALGQAVNLLFHDAQTTLVVISVISSALAVAALYWLGAALFNRTTGLLAALFLASSPLYWFYGQIALPHTLDAFVVIVAVWMLYRIVQGDAGMAAPAAIWLGIAGGLRQQTELFLAPLALYAAWRLDGRRRLIALGALIAVNLAWLIPLFQNAGGPVRYLEVLRDFYLYYNKTTAVVSGGGLWGVARNVRKLGMYTLYGWGLAIIPALLAAPVWLARSRPRLAAWLRDKRLWVLALWIGPSGAYYVFIHMGQQGLVFVYLPALLLLSAAGLSYLLEQRQLARRMIAAGLILANSLIFILAPTYPLGGERLKLLTVDTLRQHDADYIARFDAVSRNFDPAHTLILSSAWRFPQYYLPAYPLAHFETIAKWEMGEGQPAPHDEALVDPAAMHLTADANGYYYVVILDDDLLAMNDSAAREEWVSSTAKVKLAYMRLRPDERLYLGASSYQVEALPASGN